MVSNCGGTYWMHGRPPNYGGWECRDISCRRCGEKLNTYISAKQYEKWRSGECCYICSTCLPDLEERKKAIKEEDKKWREENL